MNSGILPAEPLKLSVAIPLLNEEAVVDELLQRTRKVLDALNGGPHEIVLVDDGSTDNTLARLIAAADEDPRIVVVSLSRNFGHQAAITAALDHVTGDAVVVMDGDLQDTPETIPRFLDEFRQGFDVVYAVRTDRKESWPMRLGYDLFYRLIASLAEVPLPVGAGDFGLMSRRVVDLLRQAPEQHRYLRGLRSWVGFRQIGIPVERAARQGGQPKYDLVKLLRLASDGIVSFSTWPLRLATLTGFVALMATLMSTFYMLIASLLRAELPQGVTVVVIVILFLAGVQLLCLGIIGEYVGRIHTEAKRRPPYVVDRVIRRRVDESTRVI
ncbi:MAG: glycosyltransferase family 2 protein [Pirellulales bacterium]